MFFKNIFIIGLKVVEVRSMNEEEKKREGWDHGTKIIIFENGIQIYASIDSEGNRPATLFGYDPNKNQSFYI
jgi:hypothetical protein